MITLENVLIGYNQSDVFSTITHTFAPGKVSVILGQNGVGKSTLIKIMTRQMEPLGGKVMLDGIKLQEHSPIVFAKRVAYLPQNPVAPNDITVRQLCLASRFPYKSKWRNYSTEDKEIVEKMVALLGLGEYIDTPIGKLSGGLKQRAWFAMILVQQTDIIILDEPTSFLDIAYQLELLELLTELNKTLGKTIIMILHDINHALRYADHIIALRRHKEPMIEIPELITEDFFEKVLQIATTIIQDPITRKKVAIPLHNTLRKDNNE